MRYLKTLILASIFTITLSNLSHADGTLKSIMLKDGTVIKGTVTKFENGTYTISSEKLGEINVKDSDINLIQADNFSQSATPLAAPNANNPSSGDLRSQV